jgi:hypothetical protein
LIETYPDQFPMYTQGGKWLHGGEAWTNWCEGFLGGQLWLMVAHTGDPYWRAKAEHYALLVEPRVNDRATAGPDHHRALIIHDIIPLLHTGGRWRSDTGRASGEPCE